MLTFAPGTTINYITVTVNGMAMAEPNKQFTINLSGSNGAGLLLTPHGTPSNPAVGVGTIVNDNLLQPLPWVTPPSPRVQAAMRPTRSSP